MYSAHDFYACSLAVFLSTSKCDIAALVVQFDLAGLGKALVLFDYDLLCFIKGSLTCLFLFLALGSKSYFFVCLLLVCL